MANRIQLRRDTTANWEDTDPVLADGEPGYDINTNEVRVGDGSTAWTGLSGNVIGTGGGAGTVSSLTNGSATVSLGTNGRLTLPIATNGIIIDATAANLLSAMIENQTVDFASFSGEILVNDIFDGVMYKLLVGGGKVCMMGTTNAAWDGTNVTPSASYTLAGQFTIEFTAGLYRFTNLKTGTRDMNFVAIMSRAGS